MFRHLSSCELCILQVLWAGPRQTSNGIRTTRASVSVRVSNSMVPASISVLCIPFSCCCLVAHTNICSFWIKTTFCLTAKIVGWHPGLVESGGLPKMIGSLWEGFSLLIFVHVPLNGSLSSDHVYSICCAARCFYVNYKLQLCKFNRKKFSFNHWFRRSII